MDTNPAQSPTTETRTLKLGKVRRDPRLQLRANTSKETVADYLDKLQRGIKLPPPVVYDDGKDHWLADGWHTFEAMLAKGVREADIEVHPGTKRDALVYALGANDEHGLPLTNEDKRKKVTAALADPEWQAWSNVQLAELCRVSPNFVRTVKSEMRISTKDRIGKDGRKINTENIGRSRPTKATTPHRAKSSVRTASAVYRQFEALAPAEKCEFRRLMGHEETVDDLMRDIGIDPICS